MIPPCFAAPTLFVTNLLSANLLAFSVIWLTRVMESLSFPELIMKSIIPVVMAGIIAIYGVVVSVLIAGELDAAPKYTLYK